MNIGTTGLEMKLECEGMTRNGALCWCMLLPHDCLQGSNSAFNKKIQPWVLLGYSCKAVHDHCYSTMEWQDEMA